MSDKRKGQGIKSKSEAKRYLDKLQHESWNLELIISGLAIFGLVAAHQYYHQIEYLSRVTSHSIVGGTILAGVVMAYFCGSIIFANLIIHFLLRGLWIGAVGLRSVSGDINFYQFKFQPRFSSFLKRRIKSFDDYIIGLDRICSVIFSFSFLMAFLLIGFFIFWGILILIVSGSIQLIEFTGFEFLTWIPFVFFLIYLFLGVVYLLDFLSLGWIKRIHWLSRFYYPVYRFFGFVTLARVYRPLYYNFIDDRFGRRIVLFAIPYMILIFTIISISLQGGAFYQENFFDDQEIFEGRFSKEIYYKNLQDESVNTLPRYTLDADVVYQPINKLSIEFFPEYADAIEYKFPEVKRLNNYVINSDFIIGFKNASEDPRVEKTDAQDYIKYFKSIFALKLNGRELSLDDAILLHSEKNPFPKLIKYIPLSHEAAGLQQLEVIRFDYAIAQDSLVANSKVIPFYYQPTSLAPQMHQ